MSTQLEARFQNRRAADDAVARLRRGGVAFEILELRPGRPPHQALGLQMARLHTPGPDATALLRLQTASAPRAMALLRESGGWGVRVTS